MTALTPTQFQVVKSILALRDLTKRNRMITTRTQNQILEKLSPEDLAAVASVLADNPDLSLLSVQEGSDV